MRHARRVGGKKRADKGGVGAVYGISSALRSVERQGGVVGAWVLLDDNLAAIRARITPFGS